MKKNQLYGMIALIIGVMLSLTFTACPPPDDSTAPTITTTTLPNGTVGTTYSQILSATGDTPITWSLESGALPTGLNLLGNGTISGTPTAANTVNFTVKATNAAGNDTKALSIVIASSGTPDISSFAGTWNASGGRSIVFTGNSFNYNVNSVTQYSGTFSVSGSTITFNESSLGTASGNFTLSADTIVFSNHTWDSSVNGAYTKQGGGDPSATYIITGSGSTFTAMKGTTQVGTPSNISTVINAIRTDADGANLTIQFGDGATLDLGTGSVSFSNTLISDTPWGVITLTGKLEMPYSSSNGALYIGDNVSVVSAADIEFTGTASTGISNRGTLAISGGTVSKTRESGGGGFTIYNDRGYVIISGGTVKTFGGDAIYNSGSGTVTVNGGTVEADGTNTHMGIAIRNPDNGVIDIISGTVLAISGGGISNSGTLTISGGTVSASGYDYAVSNSSGSTLTMSGGIVEATGPNNTAISNISSSVTITNGTVTATGTGFQSHAVSTLGGSCTIHSPPAVITGNTSGTITWVPPKGTPDNTIIPSNIDWYGNNTMRLIFPSGLLEAGEIFSRTDSTLPGFSDPPVNNIINNDSSTCGFSVTVGGNNIPITLILLQIYGDWYSVNIRTQTNGYKTGDEVTISYTPNGTHVFKRSNGETLGAFSVSGTATYY